MLPGGLWADGSPAQQFTPVSVADDSPGLSVSSEAGAATGMQRFFAILEVDDFVPLRATIGFAIASAVIEEIAAGIGLALQEVEIGRAAHSTIEFTFVAANRFDAEHRLSHCLEAVEQPIEVSGIRLRVKVRAAFAKIGARRVTGELFDQTLAILARARDERRRICCADEVPAQRSALDELEILRALPAALAHDEFSLHYQPKYDCRAERFGSVEALLRWTSASFGPVPTQDFITLAERTGVIDEVTTWVLGQAARDQAVMQAAGHQVTIFVNVSGSLLADSAFIAVALALIQAAPGRLGIEITETAVIGDPDTAIANIAAFAKAGVPIAIDDFGSGVSSLAHLKQLPAQELKIDKQFIDGLTRSHRDPLIVRSTIDLAHALEMKVTAEGVDDPICFSLLQMMGCDQLQGFYLSKPLPLPELLCFLGDRDHQSALTHGDVGPARLAALSARATQ